jgi:hypothetical protein
MTEQQSAVADDRLDVLGLAEVHGRTRPVDRRNAPEGVAS